MFFFCSNSFTFLVYVFKLNHQKEGGIAIHRFYFTFMLRLALHICSICWVLFVCVCLCVCFGNILNFLKKEKYLENCCDLQSERKKQSKLAARIKVFVIFSSFRSNTKKSRLCGFLHSIIQKDVNVHCSSAVGLFEFYVCVCMFLVCNYFKRENFFSTSVETKIVFCLRFLKGSECLKYVFLLKGLFTFKFRILYFYMLCLFTLASINSILSKFGGALRYLFFLS